MKKVFALLIVAVSFTACNNEGTEGSSDVKDSVLNKIDSAGDAKVDSVKNATDSLQKKVEATFEKTDSANRVVADSVNKK
jgi:formyltetrahydrofolate synthetase